MVGQVTLFCTAAAALVVVIVHRCVDSLQSTRLVGGTQEGFTAFTLENKAVESSDPGNSAGAEDIAVPCYASKHVLQQQCGAAIFDRNMCGRRKAGSYGKLFDIGCFLT